jgi:hypothetical protein
MLAAILDNLGTRHTKRLNQQTNVKQSIGNTSWAFSRLNYLGNYMETLYMKDTLGNVLEEGDLVVFTSYEGSGLSVGTVTGFTPRNARVTPLHSDKAVLKSAGYISKASRA